MCVWTKVKVVLRLRRSSSFAWDTVGIIGTRTIVDEIFRRYFIRGDGMALTALSSGLTRFRSVVTILFEQRAGLNFF
jgi:hypothetical protein